MQMTNCHWDREQKQHQTEVYWAFRYVIISRVLCQELQKTSFKPVDSQDRGFPHCPAVSKQPNWQNKIYYILYNMRDTRWLWLCSHLKYSFAGLLVSLQAMVDSTVRFEPGTISSSGTCTLFTLRKAINTPPSPYAILLASHLNLNSESF